MTDSKFAIPICVAILFLSAGTLLIAATVDQLLRKRLSPVRLAMVTYVVTFVLALILAWTRDGARDFGSLTLMACAAVAALVGLAGVVWMRRVDEMK